MYQRDHDDFLRDLVLLRAAFILLFFLSHLSPASCRVGPTPLHRLRHCVLALRHLRLPPPARRKPGPSGGMAN